MFTPWFRILGSALAIGFGALQLVSGRPSGGLFLLGGAILAVGYFRYASVSLAFGAYRRGDFPSMSRHLASTDPQHLGRLHAAYFRFLKGVEAQLAGDHQAARTLLDAGASGQLRNPRMRALALLHLAESERCIGDPEAARILAGTAKSICDDPKVHRLAEEFLGRDAAA